MKAFLLSLSFFLAVCGTAIAQKVTPLGQSDPQAKAVLDKAAARYATYKNLKADFSLQVEDKDGKLLSTQHGTVWLMGKKFKFSVGNQTVYCDGKTLWTYNKENKEVQITNYHPQEGEITPSALFTDFYDKNFLYRLEGESEIKGKATYNIDLTPLDKSKPYYKIMAHVNKSDDQLAAMKIFTKGGYHYSYQIEKYQPDVSLSDSDFTFSKRAHPGVKEVDLRM